MRFGLRFFLLSGALTFLLLEDNKAYSIPQPQPGLVNSALQSARFNTRLIEDLIFSARADIVADSYRSRSGYSYCCTSCDCCPPCPFGFIAGYSRGIHKRKTNASEYGFHAQDDIYLAGFELRPCYNVHFGITYTYIDNKTTFYNPDTLFDLEAQVPGAYFVATSDCGLFFAASGSFHVTQYKDFNQLSGSDVFVGAPLGRIAVGEILLGWSWRCRNLHFGPWGGAEYQWIQVDAYQESSSTGTPLEWDRQRTQSIMAKGGLEIYHDFCIREFLLRPRLWAEYNYEFLNNDRLINTTDGATFVESRRPYRDTVFLGASLSLFYCNRVEISASYESSVDNTQTQLRQFKIHGLIRF